MIFFDYPQQIYDWMFDEDNNMSLILTHRKGVFEESSNVFYFLRKLLLRAHRMSLVENPKRYPEQKY